MTPPSFIVFGDDWGAHPSSCQHLFQRIADTHPTLWVNTVGLRPPRPSIADAQRAVRKIARWITPTPETRARTDAPPTPEHLHVLAPPMLPWMKPEAIRGLNRMQVARALTRAARRYGITRPVLVTTVPNGVDAIGVLDEKRVVYYCVDDFTRWPGVDGPTAARIERELIGRSDVLIATSEHLARTRTRPGLATHLLPHGVDVDHFARASDATTAPWPGVKRARPVLGYLGLIDARTDATLVRELARRMPECDVVLVGPIDEPPAALAGLDNVRFIPAVSYTDVPRVLAAFDVAILPYARNELTAAINPLKLREYLASGKPVVATALPEVVKLGAYVAVADGGEAFAEACRVALAGPRDLREARREMLTREGWDARVLDFMRWIEAAPVATDRARTHEVTT